MCARAGQVPGSPPPTGSRSAAEVLERRRLLRSRRRAHRCCATGGSRSPCWRPRAAASCGAASPCAAPTPPWSPTSRRTTWAIRGRRPALARGGQAGGRPGGRGRRAAWCSTPTIPSSAAAGRPLGARRLVRPRARRLVSTTCSVPAEAGLLLDGLVQAARSGAPGHLLIGDVPFAFGGAARHNVANALGAPSAVAAAAGAAGRGHGRGAARFRGTRRKTPAAGT